MYMCLKCCKLNILRPFFWGSCLKTDWCLSNCEIYDRQSGNQPKNSLIFCSTTSLVLLHAYSSLREWCLYMSHIVAAVRPLCNLIILMLIIVSSKFSLVCKLELEMPTLHTRFMYFHAKHINIKLTLLLMDHLKFPLSKMPIAIGFVHTWWYHSNHSNGFRGSIDSPLRSIQTRFCISWPTILGMNTVRSYFTIQNHNSEWCINLCEKGTKSRRVTGLNTFMQIYYL